MHVTRASLILQLASAEWRSFTLPTSFIYFWNLKFLLVLNFIIFFFLIILPKVSFVSMSDSDKDADCLDLHDSGVNSDYLIYRVQLRICHVLKIWRQSLPNWNASSKLFLEELIHGCSFCNFRYNDSSISVLNYL